MGGEGSILDIQHPKLWTPLGELRTSHGKIFVRSEYPELYEHMCYAFDNRLRMQMDGVIVSGQCGIGEASCFTLRMMALTFRGLWPGRS